MKRFTPTLYAILALILASLACDVSDPFNTHGHNFTRGGVACEYQPRSYSDYLFTCRCQTNDKKLSGLDGYQLQAMSDEQLNLLVCGVSNPPASGDNSGGSTTQNESQPTEPPVVPTVTPTSTPPPPPAVNGVTACNYADKYVNIEMQTDANFNPQALTAAFRSTGFITQTACERVPGTEDLYTCSIPTDSTLPAKLELSYFGKPFYSYDLNNANCNVGDNGKAPDQPADNEDNGGSNAQPPLDCTVTPFPAGCK